MDKKTASLLLFGTHILNFIKSFQYFFISYVHPSYTQSLALLKELKNSRKLVLAGPSPFVVNSIPYPISLFAYLKAPFKLYTTQPSPTVDPKMTVICFRWDSYKLEKHFTNLAKKYQTFDPPCVKLASAGDTFGAWMCYTGKKDIPYMENEILEPILEDVLETLKNDTKMGIFLYGAPGNGKSSLASYLSNLCRLDIISLITSKSLSNIYLMKILANKSNCIFLVEDFDRLLTEDGSINPEKAEFSLDSLLSSLDGTWSDFKKVIFIFTANDINNVPKALIDRPGRFKHVVEIKNPSKEVRRRILGDDEEALEATEGLSLDKVFHFKERLEKRKKIAGLRAEQNQETSQIQRVKSLEHRTAKVLGEMVEDGEDD